MDTLLSESSGNARTSPIRTREQASAGLGELLRRAREDRALTLEQIAKETKIPKRHLEALEHDNLSGVPDGFYRRAEIRAYARAVKLDQDLVSAELDRALKPLPTLQPPPETPKAQEPTVSRKRVLTVIGVVVAAAVLGRVMGARDPTPEGVTQVQNDTDSPRQSAPPRERVPDAVVVTSQPTQLDRVAPTSVPAAGAPAGAMGTTGARASASNGDLAATQQQAEAGASTDSATRLVISTQPAGARVTVNGIGWGLAPVTIRHLPPGDKRIRVSKEGYATEERLVHVTEGRPRVLDIRLRTAP